MGMEKQKLISEMIHNMEKIIVGKREVVEYTLVALLAGGHILLEDVPGVGKTTLAKTLSRTIDCGFTRMQFTPDTLPSDVTGLSIYNMQTGKFEFSKGAIMNHIILVDEINRTSPKTQASLLEVMEEKQVTVDGITYQMEKPFMVVATQNPIDYLGTYNLPEAQLDRFLMRVSLGYPSPDEERVLVERFINHEFDKQLEPVVDGTTIVKMQKEVEDIKINQELLLYITKITQETRKDKSILLGASPRATLALIKASQARAYLEGRGYCIPDDILHVVYPVLCHRMILSPEAKVSHNDMNKVLKNILAKIPVPIFTHY